MSDVSDDQPAFEPPRISRVPVEIVAKVKRSVERFNLRWRDDGEGIVDDFLPEPADQDRVYFLVELLKSDLKWRQLTLHATSLEAYCRRWPELAEAKTAQLELLTCECLYQAVYDAGPEPDELHARFPAIAEFIDLADVAARAERIRARESFLGTGRFFLIRRIGKGGFGVVYDALDRERRARVALKLLPKTMPDLLLYFKREFRALADVVHPNLVSLYELFSVAGQWFFTMEHIVGVDLLSYLHGDADLDQPASSAQSETDPCEPSSTAVWTKPKAILDFNRLRGTLFQLVEGISALHSARKIHRDIKPPNILVKSDGCVVLLDFGLVVEQQSERSPDAESTLGWPAPPPVLWEGAGTAAYMSPEQARGEPLTTASDWYSLGVVLFEALTCQRPFFGDKSELRKAKQFNDAPSPSKFVDGVPDDLVALCCDLLKRDPAERPSGKEILERLQSGADRRRGSELVPLASWTIPFVGRNRHLDELRGAFDSMLAGKSAVVHLTGRSGMGKTRLLHQFLNQLESDPQTVVLSSRCHERESVPYKALDGLIDALAHLLAIMQPAESHELQPAGFSALARIFPVLKNIELVARAAAPYINPSDLPRIKRAAMTALRELLFKLGSRRPLVLVIDDMQWADRDSVTILSEMLRPPSPPRLLLLASYRVDSPACNWMEPLSGVRQRDKACPYSPSFPT